MRVKTSITLSKQTLDAARASLSYGTTAACLTIGQDALDFPMTLREPLSPTVAKTCIRSALAAGEVRFSGHAEAEMTTDDLTAVDCINVPRGGIVLQPELERGTWRYRVTTQRIAIVVVFRSESVVVIVTAWRFKR